MTARSSRTVKDALRVVTAELTAAPGERNDVEVRLGATEVAFRDTGKAPSAGEGCVAVLDTIRCALAPGAVDDPQLLIVSVRAGDGDDRVRILRPGGAPANVFMALLAADGGDGADDIAADSPALTGLRGRRLRVDHRRA